MYHLNWVYVRSPKPIISYHNILEVWKFTITFPFLYIQYAQVLYLERLWIFQTSYVTKYIRCKSKVYINLANIICVCGSHKECFPAIIIYEISKLDQRIAYVYAKKRQTGIHDATETNTHMYHSKPYSRPSPDHAYEQYLSLYEKLSLRRT